MVCLSTTEDHMTLGVPNDFAAIWIHDNYLDLITQRLRLTAGRMINVTLKKIESAHAARASVNGQISGAEARSAADMPPRRAPAPPAAAPRATKTGAPPRDAQSRNTFESFVVGSNNQMAHAAALAVASRPRRPTTPFSSMATPAWARRT